MQQPGSNLSEHVVGVHRAEAGVGGDVVNAADGQRERLVAGEPLADRALEGPRVRQPGQRVALGEEVQLVHEDAIPLREVARDDADGHVGDEPDSRARRQNLARRNVRIENHTQGEQHGCGTGGGRAHRGPRRQCGEDDRDVVEVAESEAGLLVERERHEDRGAAPGGRS